MQLVRFKKLDSEAKVPSKSYPGDAGFDLYASRNVFVSPGEVTDVPTGIAAAFPIGTFGRITGRSSTFRRRRLLVLEGVIDQQYTGELFIGVYNPNGHGVVVEKGERLAQLLLHLLVEAEWKECDELPQTRRGSNGFGSSGR